MSNAKNWCFTINNYNVDVLESLARLDQFIPTDIQYMVIGKEIGESGTPHIQGYIQFIKRQRLRQVKNFIGQSAHVEVSRGTAREASRYCMKDNDYQEFGELMVVGMFDLVDTHNMRVILSQ